MPVRILLVDDDEDDYILTRELLRDIDTQQYTLDWISNYPDALNAILKGQYDLYLVDYLLGKNSGIDILAEAAKFQVTKPIVILTGRGDEAIDREAMNLGAADYLVKNEISASLLDRTIRYNLERYKNFQRLKESENKFRMMFERSKDPMIITDASGKIYEINSSGVEFLESTRDAVLQDDVRSYYKNTSSRAKFTSRLREKGVVSDLETEFLTIKGNVRFGAISAFMQFDEERNIELYYSIIHDLTERKLHEQQVVLEEKLAAIGRIAKNLAAEIYNPLTNVNLAIDELKTGNAEQEDLMLLDLIRRNCERINNLTSQLIESTHISSLKKSRVDFTEVIEKSIIEAGSLFNLSIEANTPEYPIWLTADENSLNAVLINIFQNAADAIDPENGRVMLEVKHTSEEVSVEIMDNGEGIAKEDLGKVFEPFFTTRNRASGLGLTYSQRIIRAHDGKLLLHSKKHEGTRVSIVLPA